MVVLDASALVAVLRDEPGAGQVRDRLDGALIGAVNFAEVAGYLVRAGAMRELARQKLARLPTIVVPATADHAHDAAALLTATRATSLSLGDRFCLALARAEGCSVLTADRAWAELDLKGMEVELIR